MPGHEVGVYILEIALAMREAFKKIASSPKREILVKAVIFR